VQHGLCRELVRKFVYILEVASQYALASPLTDLPATPPPLEGVGPLTSTEPPGAERPEKVKRRPKDKKQIIDAVTELQNQLQNNRGRAAALANPLNLDTSIITSKQHYLPRSSIVMRLMEIRDDPINYFLPTQAKSTSNIFSAAPPGLTPELATLFARSMPSTPVKRKGPSGDDSPNKRSRREEVEVARRAESAAPSEGHINLEEGLGYDGDITFGDQSALVEDFQLEVDQDLGGGREKSVVTDRSRQSSLAPGAVDYDHVVDGSCPVSIFDVGQPSQTQASQGAERDQEEGDTTENEKGYSKNTVKALGLIRRELQPAGDEEEAGKFMSFKKMAVNVRRLFLKPAS